MTRRTFIFLALLAAWIPSAAVILPYKKQPTLWADSVSGSDANSGRSALLPKQTLAGVVAICGANEVIALKAGSYWRASLDLTAKTAPTIMRYGTGAAPIITGADVVTGWAAYTTGGVVNMYSKSITHEANYQGRVQVFENDVHMTRVATDAACDALPGSYVDPFNGTITPSPMTLKIHPFGSTNAASDGKTREVTVRSIVIQGPDNCTVSGVQVQRCLNNNGAMDLVDEVGCNVQRVVSEWGTKHSFGIGAGRMIDCVAMFGDPYPALPAGDASTNPYVAYLEDATGQSFEFIRCGFVGSAGQDFYFHSIGSINYASAVVRQTWTLDTGGSCYSFGSNTGSYHRDVLFAPWAGGTVSQCMSRLQNATAVNYLADSPGTATIQNSVIFAKRSQSGTPKRFAPQGTASVTNCALFAELPTSFPSGDGATNVTWMADGNANQATTVTYTIFFNGVNQIQVNSGTYTGNHNVFISSNGWNPSDKVNFQHSSGYKNTLATWQSATGQDANSVYLERADQVAGGANAFWLAWSSASGGTDLTTIGPAVGDWRINPNARVYSSGGTAYIGTYPNGAAITLAGPQTHWNWNTRSEGTGPPTDWPEPPDTLEESKTYIAAPEAWNFYP